MSDNGDDEADEPVVELGDGDAVEGAPVSRIASRLYFPIEKSTVLDRVGEETIRTPDGPRDLSDVLEAGDEVYFETSQDLIEAVRSVVGTGPVPTAGGSGAASDDRDSTDEGADDTGDSDDDADEGEFEFDGE